MHGVHDTAIEKGRGINSGEGSDYACCNSWALSLQNVAALSFASGEMVRLISLPGESIVPCFAFRFRLA